MKNFFFFPRTPKQTKDGQDVFMRGNDHRIGRLLKV